MSTGSKIITDGGQSLAQNPFGALSGTGLPQSKPLIGLAASATTSAVERGRPGSTTPATSPTKGALQKNRGRVDIKRTTAGRGGKTVTLVTGFVGIGLPEKEQLAKKIRGACGCGGTVKDGDIEIQGDQRETIARILTEAGFRPVMAGG
jgi:translation initiation factor 1